MIEITMDKFRKQVISENKPVCATLTEDMESIPAGTTLYFTVMEGCLTTRHGLAFSLNQKFGYNFDWKYWGFWNGYHGNFLVEKKSFNIKQFIR